MGKHSSPPDPNNPSSPVPGDVTDDTWTKILQTAATTPEVVNRVRGNAHNN